MTANARTPVNKTLPKYWRFKHGTYSYRVPPHLRAMHGGKGEISLGQNLPEAYRKFASFHEVGNHIRTMSDLFDRYSVDVVAKHSSANTRKFKIAALARLRPAMGENPVAAITSTFIYDYRDHIGGTRSMNLANGDLRVLSHCFTKSIQWGARDTHPMTGKKVVQYGKNDGMTTPDRYVTDAELLLWAPVANPFLVAFVVLKGSTALRQQDLLTIKRADISDTHLVSDNLKTGKKLRFPLWTADAEPTTVQMALTVVHKYYNSRPKLAATAAKSPWLFHNRTGGCYYNMEKDQASGFGSIWQRSMRKALRETALTESFREQDLRAKASSDLDSDMEAQKLLAHASAATTRKHYRRKGTLVQPAGGFTL